MNHFGTIVPQKTTNVIDEETGKLSKIPVKIRDNKIISKPEDYRDSISDGNINFSILDDIRTQFRADVKGARGVLLNRSGQAVNKVYNATKDDIDNAVKMNMGNRELYRGKQAKMIYAGEAGKVKIPG